MPQAHPAGKRIGHMSGKAVQCLLIVDYLERSFLFWIAVLMANLFADHYRVEKELDRGSLGVVFLAYDKRLSDRVVDVKILHSALAIDSTMISDKDGRGMVYVSASEFFMCSPDGERNGDEFQRRMYLDASWIDETEVANAMYQKCVAAGACSPNENLGSSSNDPDRPVVGVCWHDANNCYEWASRCLPAGLEWERTACSADGRGYPWCNQVPHCNITDMNNCMGVTTLVGSYPVGASPCDVLDMSDNMWG
jgi:formylglycine-generating enzyme required for sulfatase activity